jgi:hypothetical protein
MNRSLIISRTRVEVRRKKGGLPKERVIISWLQKFFDDMSIDHSSQIRIWQKEAFLSKLKSSPGYSREEFLQASSALLFLYSTILGMNEVSSLLSDVDSEPGVFKITA